jgi:hypothetical protein
VIFAEISTGIEEIVIIFTVIRKDELDFWLHSTYSTCAVNWIYFCYDWGWPTPPPNIYIEEYSGVWRWGIWKLIELEKIMWMEPPWWDWCSYKTMKGPELFYYIMTTKKDSPLMNQEADPQ